MADAQKLDHLKRCDLDMREALDIRACLLEQEATVDELRMVDFANGDGCIVAGRFFLRPACWDVDGLLSMVMLCAKLPRLYKLI